ncbi:hypothetical protein [Micromonospora craniellae]|uniref:Uncharacterized protein n=1 Tax=Micromonospora craniellae TaxID=2294034 RepID=A0A372FRU8_9ACTN|nr:hypothetical protein [Micromonospora craniellae]QOC93480.1 hypothetical protein ID554_07390 [Micromonospora craniellae]RFS43471.1 hypothetical protein D0Q02_27705 [Micromonospora craniellae]
MSARTMLSAAVMAHPRRSVAVARLRQQLPGLNVALDPRPDGPPTSVRSAAIAWGAVAPDATHHLVLEDDALPCTDLLDGCTALARRFPAAAVALFVNDSARTAAVARMAVWSGRDVAPVIDIYVPTQGLILPAETARGLAAFLSAHDDLAEAGDIATLRYLCAEGIAVLVAVPNLVDHDDLSSIIGNDDHGRRGSACYLGHRSDAGTCRQLELPELIPYLSESTTRSILTSTPAADRSFRGRTADLLAVRPLPNDLARRSEAAGLPPAVPGRPVYELWVTAVASGMLLTGGGHCGPDEVRRHAATPAGRAAAASMAPGGLGRSVPRSLLANEAGLLTDIVLHGVTVGADAGVTRRWPTASDLLSTVAPQRREAAAPR